MEQFLLFIFIILGIILLMVLAKSMGHSFARGFLQELNIFIDHQFHKLLKQGDQNNGKKKEKK